MERDPQDTKRYSIGQFAKLTGFPVGTLRYYDEADVLKPAFVDPETGYRSYTEVQRKQMLLLTELHFMQVPVELLRDFMRNPTLEHQGEIYDWKIRQLHQDIQDRQQDLLSLMRKRAHPWQGQQYEVMVQERPSRPWAFVQYVTKMRRFEPDRERAFEAVRAVLERQGVKPASPPMTFSLPVDDLRRRLTGVEVYAGFEVSGPVPVEGDVLLGATPAGLWFGVQHTGPYEHIWHVMAMLLEYAQREGVPVLRGRGVSDAGGVSCGTVGHPGRGGLGHGRAMVGPVR
ncbi:MerR family DNA-binding transcriptional regulator [Deinococcus malanensis]|uniref:MerR family transcriptional regulator n=1 Tax=Deinococcus malanensis TaxID=1706855 RepID=UPI0036398812